MFWGLIMEPQRRYTQIVKKPFHISMAALDVSTSSDEPAQIMCGFEGRNYLLCTLRKPDMLQCSLDLNFEAGDELSLATNGKCHVHLTGYLVDEDSGDFLAEEEEEEVEEELDERAVKKKNKKRNKVEVLNGPPQKKSKKEQDSEDDDSELDVRHLLEDTLDSDDEDESFNEDNLDDDGNVEETSEEEDDEDLEEDGEEEESSLSEAESEEETKQSKKNKTKMNGSPKKQEQEQQSPKQKKNKKNQQKKEDKNSSIKENQSPKKESPKKTLQNGLIIEDLKEGQGHPVKSGKFITVYYEGRLKSNNKVFDSTKQGQGFSFKVGSGEVIKGWDVGLLGMKLGGKRRITCPPNMAYGLKGSPPAIPGNSTLVFEVELRKIR